MRVVKDAEQAAQQVALAAHGGYVERDLGEINLQTQEEDRAQIEEQDLARGLLGAGDVGGDNGDFCVTCRAVPSASVAVPFRVP